MPRRRIWGWVIAGIFIPTIAMAQEPPTSQRAESGWKAPWEIFDTKETVPARPVTSLRRSIQTMPPQKLVGILELEQKAYARRLDVCTQLRKVAVETNNPSLAAKAAELEEKAELVYQTRLRRLGIRSGSASTAPVQEIPSPTTRQQAQAYVSGSQPAIPTQQPNAFREVQR